MSLGMQISGSDFVQHRCEQNKILAADQRYFNICTASKVFIEILCRVQSSEAAAGDNYFGLLHFFWRLDRADLQRLACGRSP